MHHHHHAAVTCSCHGTRALQAQYNAPIADYGGVGIPANRVRVACELLSDSTLEGSNLLTAMVSATSVFDGNASVSRGCLDITGAQPEPYGPAPAPAGDVANQAPKAESETVSRANPKQISTADIPTDAVFSFTSSDKFDYQVRHARWRSSGAMCVKCCVVYSQCETYSSFPLALASLPITILSDYPPEALYSFWHAGL